MTYIRKSHIKLLSTAAVLMLFQGHLFSKGIVTPAFFSPELQKEFIIVDSVQNYDLNPHTATYASEAQLLTGLYEGLFSYDPKTLEPLSAISETHLVSEDKLVWTFSIRKEVKFSNGDPITADTIRNSWLSLLDPEKKAPYASLLDCIAGAEAYRTGAAGPDGAGNIGGTRRPFSH